MPDDRPRVLFDTSVLLPALVEKHPRHGDAASRLARVHAGEIQLLICTHTLAELFSTLTALPVSPRIGPEEARRLITENVVQPAEIVPLEAADYTAVMNELANLGLSGGMIYDLLHVQAARKARADQLWTLNELDFVRVWPDHGGKIEGI